MSSSRSQGHTTGISPGCCCLLGDLAPRWPRELSAGFVSFHVSPQLSLCSGARTSATGNPSGTKSLWLQSQRKCRFADFLARATCPVPRYPLLPDNATCTLPSPKDQWWPFHPPRCALCSRSVERATPSCPGPAAPLLSPEVSCTLCEGKIRCSRRCWGGSLGSCLSFWN